MEKKKKWKDFQFNLFGTTWTVAFVDKGELTDDSGENLGESIGTTNKIWVALHDTKGNALSDEQITVTLYHEIVHAIFTTGQYLNCTNDEPFVEWTARCIKSLVEQKAF